MTNELAIAEIKNYDKYPNGLSKECRDYILKALEPQPSEDCISRNEAIARALGLCLGGHYNTIMVVDMIKDLPPVTPTRKVGKWVKKSQYGNDYCSECNYEHCGYGYPKYCPNCGAEMRGADKC